MSEYEKRKKRKKIFTCIVILLLVILIILILIWLLKGKETQISEDDEGSDWESLVCTTGENDEAYFKNSVANGEEHKIKLIFIDDKLSRIFYSYTGEYNSVRTAQTVIDSMHADYNIYMGDNKMTLDLLSPTFSAIDKTVRIDLYGWVSDVNAVTAKLFFFDRENYEAVKNYSEDRLEAFYENKGFSCEK